MMLHPTRFSTDDNRWLAVTNRDPEADGSFFYSVCTTGIYCRPVCPAKRPLRKNVRFHSTVHDAERAGFRPCQRCRPTESGLAQRHAQIVATACREIEAAEHLPSLGELAQAAGVSTHHFHRLFKAHTGLTPKAYGTACRNRRISQKLTQTGTITEAIHGAGFQSNSRFYDSSNAVLGMTPKAYRAGGAGRRIRFAVGECWLGAILAAATAKGVCCILLGDDPETLVHDLQDRFSKAELIGDDVSFQHWMATVVGFVSDSTVGLDLPLDIQGTAFQHRVWSALRAIPPGSTATYREIAERIEQPKSIRAVARACGANPLAVAIPCHRVIRTDGGLAGYRWGIERKIALLRRERQEAPSAG